MMRVFKTFALLFALCGLLLCMAGCNAEPIHKNAMAKTLSFETLEDMEDHCGTIIKCVRLDGEQPVITKVDNRVVSTYTFSQVQVTEVFKDVPGVLEIGSVITILENEAYDKEANIIYHVAGYNMMEVGEEYLLFLTRHQQSDDNYYYVAAGINYGTISLCDDARGQTRKAVDGLDFPDNSIYQDIWQAAKDKYIP